MQVVLLEKIEKLGFMGDVVTVKPGFARNYLLPQKKALRASRENIAYFESQKSRLEADNLKNKQEAEKVAEKAKDTVLVIIRQAGDTGHLYGSVTPKDISKVSREQGFEITSQQVRIVRPIKEIGLHSANISLHPEVSVDIFINVAKSVEEAETQWLNKDKSAEEVKEEIAAVERAKSKGRADLEKSDESEEVEEKIEKESE